MDSQKSGQNCNSPPLSSTQGSAGCGCPSDITVNITPTTGGSWFIRVDPQTSIENFKKIVSKKLKVHKERICLLYRDKQLREGTLLENGLVDGSRLTLLPSVETGLLTQRPELSVMQALESLNDNQVNDFLSGKAPLNLTMRLGDHMMLIQLQLSTVTAGASSSTTVSSGANNTSTSSITPPSSTSTSNSNQQTSATSLSTTSISHSPLPVASATSASTHHSSSTLSTSSSSRPRTSSRISAGNRQVLLSSLASALAVAKEDVNKTKILPEPVVVPPADPMGISSPIQSLSDLASRPTVPVPTAARIPQSRSPPHNTASTDPIAAGLTSCLCRSLSPPCSCTTAATTPSNNTPSTPPGAYDSSGTTTRLDTRALAQASRNLTQTLRQLSTEVLSSREIEQRAQGAIIESMQHHGRGVYSGTFSGTLNPALQDSRGRPRRDISTIVHILNDLLCASPPTAATASTATSSARRSDLSPIPNSYNHLAPAGVSSPKSPSCECSRCITTATTSSSTPTPTDLLENPSASSALPFMSAPSSNASSMHHHHSTDLNAEQNSRTRDKIEQLRLVMGERRERRRLRKQKIQPYTIPTAETQTSTDAVSA